MVYATLSCLPVNKEYNTPIIHEANVAALIYKNKKA